MAPLVDRAADRGRGTARARAALSEPLLGMIAASVRCAEQFAANMKLIEAQARGTVGRQVADELRDLDGLSVQVDPASGAVRWVRDGE